MKIEDTIEALNKCVDDRRAIDSIESNIHLVLQKTITSNNTFKAYKNYNYILWAVESDTKGAILKVVRTIKVLSGQEEKASKEMDIEFSIALFRWVMSADFTGYIKSDTL